MRHGQYHTRITGLPYRFLGNITTFPRFRFFPSFVPSFAVPGRSVQSVVGRAIHLSFKTNKHSFFPPLTTSPPALFARYPNTSRHPLCVAGCLNGRSSSPSAFFFLGFFSYVRVLFSQVFFGLPRIREYRPGRFPSYAFVSPVARSPPKYLIAQFYSTRARGYLETPEGRKPIAIE